MDSDLLKILLDVGKSGGGVSTVLLGALIVLLLQRRVKQDSTTVPLPKAEELPQWVRQITSDLARVGDDLAHVRDLVMEYHREETNKLEDLHRKVIELRFRPPAA